MTDVYRRGDPEPINQPRPGGIGSAIKRFGQRLMGATAGGVAGYALPGIVDYALEVPGEESIDQPANFGSVVGGAIGAVAGLYMTNKSLDKQDETRYHPDRPIGHNRHYQGERR